VVHGGIIAYNRWKVNSNMAEKTILIVEDDPEIGELIQFHTTRENYVSDVIVSGQRALESIRRTPPDLVILDLMLPDLDGLEICRRVRWDEKTRRIPILIVSAKGEESDIVMGLELGADDYVTKPFSPKVLMARIRNLLRRVEETHHPASDSGTVQRVSLSGGRLVIDCDRRTITLDGEDVEFTRSEFDILNCIVSKPGFVRTRDQIIAAVHGDEMVLSSRTVDVHLAAIRRKLGTLAPLIHTVRGVGYRLEESAIE